MANIDVYSLTLPNDNNAYWLKDKSLQDAKGAANGIAELDSTGKVPSSQLPEIPSGGHTIKNSAGTSMTQRENLQFVDATVSDDSTNDITKVENVHIINSESELTNAPDGLYMGSYDDAGDAIGASDVAYSNTISGIVSTDVQSAIDEIVAMKGANSGFAELDATGKVPSSQLPSYVDDVIEVTDYSHLPITGETGKIYVTLDDNKTYRWSGSAYVEISESLALGETSSTAYAGDKGKANADNITTIQGLIPSNATTSNKLATANDIPDISGKADKVTSATNGNLAGLNASGNLTDSGWDGAKTTTSASGNPISITGLKSNQLAVNPVITFGPIQDLHGYSNPWPGGGGRNLLSIDNPGSNSRSGVTYTMYADGKITANGTSTGDPGVCYRDIMTSLHNLVPGSSYKIASNGNVLLQVLQYVNGSWSQLVGATIGPQGFTISSSATNLLVRSVGNSGTVYTNAVSYPVIVENTETDTSFAPYENICEISGYDKIEVLSCGKNLFDGTIYQRNCGYTANGEFYNGYSGWSVVLVKVEGLSKITESGGTVNTLSDVFLRSTTLTDIVSRAGNHGGTHTYDVPDGAKYFAMTVNNDNSENGTIQVEEGQTATTYEPYHKTTDLSENLPQTVYGGTLDVRTGKLVSNLGSIDLGSLTFSKDTSYSQNVFYAYSTSIPIPKNDSASAIANIISEIYKADSANNIDRATTNYTVGVMQYNTGARIWICDSRYTSATDLQNALSGVKAVYELKTPIEIQLTPHEISLLKDYAYVSTNGTSIALDYHNGEIATLGDVSQLGETVNELGDITGIASTLAKNLIYNSTTVVSQLPDADGSVKYILLNTAQTVGSVTIQAWTHILIIGSILIGYNWQTQVYFAVFDNGSWGHARMI